MRLLICAVGVLLAGPALVGCIPTPDPAEEAALNSAASQVAALQAAATQESARLRTTLDYAGTRVSLAATQGSFLELTLEARGTPPAVIASFRQEMFASFATPTPTPTLALRGDATVNAAQPPTQIIITPLAISTLPGAPPADPNAPRLENIVTAVDVGSDDCAVGITNVFTTAMPEIYVVARARNIPNGTRLASRWRFNGEQVIRYEFTPNFTIQDACIWFFMDQTDVTFSVGEWTVQLEINDVPAAPPSAFSIRSP
jgi:hypothetical protein